MNKQSTKIDIGCGTPEQKKKGYYGIDINPDYEPDLLWDCSNGIPLNDNSVESIWMDNSLEHFKDPHYILRECHRVLKEDGELIIALPNVQFAPVLIAGWFGDIQLMWNWWMNSRFKEGRSIHYTLWTPEVLRQQLRELQMTVIEEKGWHLGKTFTIRSIK